MKPIATFINDKDGLASRIFRTESGFIVTLMDIDAKRELPTRWHYQEEERALKRAEFLLFPERFRTEP
jgi:hypothetical protein